MSAISTYANFNCADLPLATYRADEVVLAAGSRTGRLLFLKEGAVAIVRQSTQIAIVDEPGAVFGEISALLDRPHTAEVRTLVHSQFYVADACVGAATPAANSGAHRNNSDGPSGASGPGVSPLPDIQVALGLVTNLSRPEGNLTGVTSFTRQLGPKQLGLLQAIIPSASVISVFVNRYQIDAEVELKDIQEAARTSGLRILPIDISGASEPRKSVCHTYQSAR